MRYRTERLPLIGDKERRVLYQLVEDEGLTKVAKWIGVSDVTLLRVLANLGHRCRHAQLQKIRRFFSETR